MKKLCLAVLLFLVLIVCLDSCATGSDSFDLEESGSKTVVMTLVGELEFNGYYFPSSEDTVEIRLVSSSGFLLSSQKIMNVTKFPIRFVLRYDASEVNKSETYRLEADLLAQSGSKTASADVMLDKDKESVLLVF